MYGEQRVRAATTKIDGGHDPNKFVYEYVEHVSGPSGGDGTNMNGNASLGDPSIYELDVGIHWLLARINMGIFDAGPTFAKFGGIAALTNGVQILIVDNDGVVLQDFTGGRPITKNADFNYLAGIDSVIDTSAGQDLVRIRFTILRAGDNMLLLPGHKIRFVIQDDLSGIDEFRAMGQGLIVQ